MKRFTCWLLTVALTVSLLALPASAVEFSDIQGHWAQTSMEQVAQWGLFSGNQNGEFLPNNTMTRGMFVAVMERTAKLLGVYQAPTNPVPFDDVKETDYFASASTWAREVGLVTGVGNNQLAPNTPISRQQMCAMMARFLEKCVGLDLSAYTGKGNTFLDQSSIASYALKSVEACVALGLIQGYSVSGGVEFRPQNSATRAAVAVVLERLVNVVQKQPGEVEQPGEVQQPGGAGGEQTPPESQEPTEQEKADEAKMAGYLQTMLDNYRNSTYLPTTDQAVQDCMAILMDAISDALAQRQNGQFLDRDFIREQYADEIDQLKTQYDQLTKDQLNQINNAIVKLGDTEEIYFVMDYFGVSIGN